MGAQQRVRIVMLQREQALESVALAAVVGGPGIRRFVARP